MEQVEHREWRGALYEQGFRGKKVFIVGHSHYASTPEEDCVSLTEDVVSSQVRKQKNFAFFRAIQNAFGEDTDFWHKVVFFNFLPNLIGTKDDMFNQGSEESNARGRTRFWRLLGTYKPDKVLVFSNDVGKGWRKFPNTREEDAGKKLYELADGLPWSCEWGTYGYYGHVTQAFGIRHPLWDTKGVVKNAVPIILERYWS